MPGFYTSEERVRGPVERRATQWVGTVDSVGERGQSPIYDVLTRHPASGKPWLLHGVRETVSRFYKADGGRWEIGDRVVVVRSGHGLFEIVGAAPDGRSGDPASIQVGGASIDVDGAAATGGVTLQAGTTRQRTAPDGYSAQRLDAMGEPKAALSLTDEGPYLSGDRWASRPKDGVQEARGVAAPAAMEESFRYLLLDPDGVTDFATDPAALGFRLPLRGTLTKTSSGPSGSPHTHDVTINLGDFTLWGLLPARLSRVHVVADPAAGPRGAFGNAVGDLPSPYGWVAPTLADVSADPVVGPVHATISAAAPPNVAIGDVRIVSAPTSASQVAHEPIFSDPGARSAFMFLPRLLPSGASSVESVAGGVLFRHEPAGGRPVHYWIGATHATASAGAGVPATAGATFATFLGAVAGAGLRSSVVPDEETRYFETEVTAVDTQGRVLPSPPTRYAIAIFRVYP